MQIVFIELYKVSVEDVDQYGQVQPLNGSYMYRSGG